MAYSGYLIKVGNYTIPLSLIRAETYVVLKSGQDLDSYRDSNGLLHRQALDHWIAKAEFETKPLMTNKEMSAFLNNISNNYTNVKEKKANVNLYIPELDDYVNQEMYVPDISFTIYTANSELVKYNSTRIAFIGY